MYLYHYNTTQFFDYLKSKGCTINTDDSPDTNFILASAKNGCIVPVEIMKSYYFPIIIKVCEALEIETPEEFIKQKQEMDLLHEVCKRVRENQDPGSINR